MRFIADFHIHSKYSLATSKFADLPHLAAGAKQKGVDVIGTGDCIHPKYLQEIKEQLIYNDNGLYSLKNDSTNFILTTEISNVYKKNGKTRKVHNLCILPTTQAAEKFQKRLEKIGNIASDGRPILGLDSKILLEILLETDDKAFLIPAHIWTPWFSVLGSKSGFNTIDECYEDLTSEIFALETGLSSDPPMNWACSFLDKFRLVSNSDAHSPEKIGREANIFDCEKSYEGIYRALKYDEGFVGTIEFFPQEGKYYDDGHRNCNICFNPLETIQHNGICPVCNTPLTKGVMHRVAELADRDNLSLAPNRKKFYSITSLPDLVSEITGKGVNSKATQEEYFKILKTIGSDFHTLLFANLNTISKKHSFVLAEGIRRMREAEVQITHGFDGEFGTIKSFKSHAEIEEIKHTPLFAETEEKRKLKPQLHFDVKKFQKEQQKNIKPDTVDLSKYIDLSVLQKTIINHKEGPLVILGGAGTGKTKVLIERIAMLVRSGVADSDILVVTLNEKACENIKQNLAEKILSFNLKIITFNELTLEKSFKYILIDEFQEMNAQQYELIKSLLPKKNPNLFMVGDTDQVFDKKFPIIKLQKSYRCPTNVLKIAAQIIEKNEFLEGHNFSEKPEIIECENADCEAEFIAKKIKKLALTNVAIICPTSEIVEKFKKYSCKSVSVMTMNESKGLEFDCVFIPACEILEERLFYIAITRTKKYLFLSYAKKRFFNHRLVTLNKSSILDLFEQNLIKASKAKIKPSKKQIEFAF